MLAHLAHPTRYSELHFEFELAICSRGGFKVQPISMHRSTVSSSAVRNVKVSTGSCDTGWYAADATAADLVTSYSNTA